MVGKEYRYKSVEQKEDGPFVFNGIQNHNYDIVKDFKLRQNTDNPNLDTVLSGRLPRDLREFVEPKERRLYEFAPHKWPRPDKPIRLMRSCNDKTYKPPTPLKEMKPYPKVDKFRSKVVHYLDKPYYNTVHTNYLTGAKKRGMLNNEHYEKVPGRYAPEPFNSISVNRKRDKKDVYYIDTRKYIQNMDNMVNPINDTPYTSRMSYKSTSRLAVPATPRKIFNTPSLEH